jgi:hypothetical protein
MQDETNPDDAPSGLPAEEPEEQPLGVPEADPGGERTDPGRDAMPGIPGDDEPPAAS